MPVPEGGVADGLDGGMLLTHGSALPNPACCPLTVARHSRLSLASRYSVSPVSPFLLFRCGQEALQRGEVIGPLGGSVRSRASQYRLNWNEANPGSCGLQDSQHRHTPAEKEESLAIGGHVLMGAGARAEDVAEFIVGATEPSG